MTMDVQEIAEQAIPVEERDQSTPVLTVQALKEIKKSRRTVMLAAKLPSATPESPLTPPLSERASNDVEGLYGPEREERYESIALSSEDGEWDHRQGQQSAPPMDASEDVSPAISGSLTIGNCHQRCNKPRGARASEAFIPYATSYPRTSD